MRTAQRIIVQELSLDQCSEVTGGAGRIRLPRAVTKAVGEFAESTVDLARGCGKGLAFGLAGEPQGPAQRDGAALCSGEWLGPASPRGVWRGLKSLIWR